MRTAPTHPTDRKPPRGSGLCGARGGAGNPCVVPRSRPALSPYARTRSSGEKGVCSLRPQAFCAVSGASRPRPLGGWLRPVLPQGAGQTWLDIFNILPYYGQPLGGRVPQGGAHTLPPSSRPAQCFADCFCVTCSLLLRPVCASLAWLLVAARIRGYPAARRAARGLPRSPRPLRSRALGRFAPRRALSPPTPWARKRAPNIICRPLGDCGGSPGAPAPAPPSPRACICTPPYFR